MPITIPTSTTTTPTTIPVTMIPSLDALNLNCQTKQKGSIPSTTLIHSNITQSPNQSLTWFPNQQPKHLAMTGPRYVLSTSFVSKYIHIHLYLYFVLIIVYSMFLLGDRFEQRDLEAQVKTIYTINAWFTVALLTATTWHASTWHASTWHTSTDCYYTYYYTYLYLTCIYSTSTNNNNTIHLCFCYQAWLFFCNGAHFTLSDPTINQKSSFLWRG